MKKFKGFTMTELMVALAVVGILIAIVTPAIFKSRPNKNKMMVKKSFYVAEQIVSSLINDDNLYPDKRANCLAEPKTNCAWGFDDTAEVTYEGVKYSGNTKFYELFKNMINVKTEDSTNHTFYTSDGIKWDLSKTVSSAWNSGQSSVGKFSDSSPAAGKGIILIDVNGDETPNTRCKADSVDCDQYQIEILANGKMRIDPNDTKAIEYVTINTSIKD